MYMQLKSELNFVLVESWHLFKIALPIYLSIITSELIEFIIPSIYAGHFGDTRANYASVTLGNNMAISTGVIPHLCLSSALSTLASQAYGGRRNKYISILYQRGLLIHQIMCLPIALIWINATNIFTILGQTAELSTTAGRYMNIYIFALPCLAILHPTLKILQIQDIVLPSTVIYAIGSLIEAIVSYLLIFHTNMGVSGLALAVVITVYFITIAHLIYLRTMSVWDRIWDGLKWEAFECWGQYVYYGMPILATLSIELIVFHFGVLLIGAVSQDPSYEISIYSIVSLIDLFLLLLSLAFQSATSIRIGCIVGEGNIAKMKKVAILTTLMTFPLQLIQISILIAGRSIWGYIVTSNHEIAEAVINFVFLLAAIHPIEGIVMNFQGILVGIGKQKFGLLIPFLFILFSLPISTIFTVVLNMGPLGYWLGILIGVIIRFVAILPISFCCIRWDNIVAVTQMEQHNVESMDSSSNSEISSLSGSIHDASFLPESKQILSTIKIIISHLKFKIMFLTIILISLIVMISCNLMDSKVNVNISSSYLAQPIEFCCIKFTSVGNALNVSSLNNLTN